MGTDTFPRSWKLFAFSMIGKREQNQDRLAHFVKWFDKDPVVVFIACDGVGGLNGGAECAEELIAAVQSKLDHLLTTYGLLLLKDSHRLLLRNELRKLRVSDELRGATTMVSLMFKVRRSWNGYQCAAIWAGDSRAHIIDAEGQYLLLTRDHHDDEESLTAAYVAKEGHCKGNVDVRHVLIPFCPLGFGVTTDGVHAKCTEEELRCFLAWCLLQTNLDSDSFAVSARTFLEENLSDNLSAAFLMRRRGLPRKLLSNVLEQGGVPHV